MIIYAKEVHGFKRLTCILSESCEVFYLLLTEFSSPDTPRSNAYDMDHRFVVVVNIPFNCMDFVFIHFGTNKAH